MRYSAFEQAAVEASNGMKEIETQLEQLMAQMDQLKGKRDLLDTLSRQLSQLQPTGESMPVAAATPSISATEAPAEMPALRPAVVSSADVAAEMAAAAAAYSARSLREEWMGRPNSEAKGPSSESTIRGRL